ncbi:MAG: hypothetical protein Q4F67_11975 [Propionibacteriaceae bacterium]|nr:hypothetical protein [Propionibacteriaceae bacterium]
MADLGTVGVLTGGRPLGLTDGILSSGGLVGRSGRGMRVVTTGGGAWAAVSVFGSSVAGMSVVPPCPHPPTSSEAHKVVAASPARRVMGPPG